MTWLTETPLVLVRALAAKIPALEAAQIRRLATAVSLGSGTLRDEDRRALVRALDEQGGRRQGSPRRVHEAPPGEIAALGIAFSRSSEVTG